MAEFSLNDKNILNLKNKILDSFRVRPDRNPIYVEIGGYLDRVLSFQNQVIFGRRGSGKSCVTIKGLNDLKKKKNVVAIYINADNVKRLQYPDLLIRLLLDVMEEMRRCVPFFMRLHPGIKPLKKSISELRALLDKASKAQITEESKFTKSGKLKAKAKNDDFGISAGAESESSNSFGRIASFHEEKLDTLERHLKDYVSAMEGTQRVLRREAMLVFIDDFYLIPRRWQAYVADYVHRLFRNSSFFFKIATIRHRTNLYRADGEQTIGIEPSQDVEEINLDKTLQDLPATKSFLSAMLDEIGQTVSIEGASEKIFNREALEDLTLASGGVARDFLNILVDAIDESVANSSVKWLTPTFIWKAASRQSYRTKLKSLREDAESDLSALEKVYSDLIEFCLRDKKKTAFLISQDEVQKYPYEHELIQQLMDFKLIHVIEPDTSASSGRTGRYEAYTLDFATFMEPRLRNIEHVEFWKIDDQRRRKGLRESPVYSLEQARNAHSGREKKNIEDSIEKIRVKNSEQAAEAVPKAVGDLFGKQEAF